MKLECPYCQAPLDSIPKRSRKCLECDHRIIANTKRSFFAKPLLTEDELFISGVFEQLSSAHGVTIKTYLSVRKDLVKRFGETASWSDVTWEIHQQLADKYARSGQHDKLSYVRASEARILAHEKRDPIPSLRKQHAAWLISAKSMGAKRVEVDAALDSKNCAACQKLNGRIFSTEIALSKLPIPPDGCICIARVGYCTCSFIAVF